MKEFKKWYKENGPSLYPGGASAAWKAALEWVYDLYQHKSNNPELFEELIKKELELDDKEEYTHDRLGGEE